MLGVYKAVMVRMAVTFITTVLASSWRQISYNGRTAYIGPAAFK
jgi:hypothetical protein